MALKDGCPIGSVSTNDGRCKVILIFGTEATDAFANKNGITKDEIEQKGAWSEYLGKPEEVSAFLLGVDEAIGWMEYDIAKESGHKLVHTEDRNWAYYRYPEKHR